LLQFRRETGLVVLDDPLNKLLLVWLLDSILLFLLFSLLLVFGSL
jgi:hypothetical protein